MGEDKDKDASASFAAATVAIALLDFTGERPLNDELSSMYAPSLLSLGDDAVTPITNTVVYKTKTTNWGRKTPKKRTLYLLNSNQS